MTANGRCCDLLDREGLELRYLGKVTRHFRHALVVSLVLAAVVFSGCASTGAFQKGNSVEQVGNWDEAVALYRQAVQEDPTDPDYRIALVRAMQNAAMFHFERALALEEREEFPAALAEYRLASGYDPTNGQLRATVSALEGKIRDIVEALRPPSPIERLREQARVREEAPLLDSSSNEPLTFQFSGASLRDILDFIGTVTAMNVIYDREFQDRTYTVRLEGVSVEEALKQILIANQCFYKVLDSGSIIIVPDTPQKRAQYEEQVIRTFFVSHANVAELATLLTQIVRAPNLAVQPQIVPNIESNTITVRATTAVAAVIEKVISTNDKPPAEVIVDVEILEVNRERARQFGLDLAQYSIGTLFSPSSGPSQTSGTNLGTGVFDGSSLSDGINISDFYGAVPAAIVNFLETDSETRLIAKPQLRGQEGTQLTLNLGDDIPVPSTSFTAIATGGVAVNPLTSFEYRSVGVNLVMTPRVTYNNEIVLDLEVENSTLGPNINVAGQPLPTFGTRRVITRLRLRDGESNLLAGLLREEDRQSLRGFPGILRLPVIKQLFSSNEDTVKSTDIIMLLTPRIVRTHELKYEDVSPIYIGTQQNIGLIDSTPLIAPVRQAELEPEDFQEGAVVTALDPRKTTELPLEEGAVRFGGVTDLSPSLQASNGTGSNEVVPLDVAQSTFGTEVSVFLPKGSEFMVGNGPYTVPISIKGASQLTTLSLTLLYNAEVLRAKIIQEGNFMRQGSANVTFVQQVDPAIGRIDITQTRTGDQTGASGSGLVASVVFEAVGSGLATLLPSGLGLTPKGAPLAMGFTPITVSVR